MSTVYILFSNKANRFYTRFTSTALQTRLDKHSSHYYQNKFTAKFDDWELFLEIKCSSIQHAQLIEKHIKKMKSSTYIKNLKSYPEMIEKLIQKYNHS